MDCGREEEFRYQVISLFTILNLPVYKYFFTLDRAAVSYTHLTLPTSDLV